jgi:preprotein translocase SecE subunit
VALQRYVIVLFVIGSVMLGTALRAASDSLFEQLAIQNASWLGDSIQTSGLVGLVGAAVTFFALLRNRDAVTFVGEVVGELAKVTWPSREEAVRATSTVIFTTLFMAVVIGVFDLVWKNVAEYFLFGQS